MSGVGSYLFGLLWMTQVPTWELMMFGITFTAAGGAMAITSMNSLVSGQAAEHERGLVLGVFNSAAWTGRSIGPVVAGLLFQGIGVQAPLYGGAVVMSIVLIMVGLVRHRTKRREDQQGV